MPFVNVRTAKGLLDDETRRELHERLTDVLVEVEGRGNPDFRPLVYVLIEEEEPKNWSIGGSPVTEEQVRLLAAER